MGDLPERVMETLKKLRSESPPPPYIIARKIHGRYYVYSDLISKDKEDKKRLSSEYMGRITDDGIFIKRAITKGDELENARAIIEAHGGKVMLPETREAREPRETLTRDEVDNKILTILSMNARATLPFIASRVGLSVSAVDNRIKRLEKRYGIKYLAEIDIEKLGYLEFIILVKFKEKTPDVNRIKEAINPFNKIQLAILLNGGDYDLLIYALAETNNDISFLSRDLMNTALLSKYPSEWYTAPFYNTYNFVPLNNNFIETLNERLTGKRDLLEESIIPRTRALLTREFAVLRELNENGKTEFREIDKKYNFDTGRAQYSYHKLVETGLLKRVTINMQNTPFKYIAILFVKVTNPGEFADKRSDLLRNIIDDGGYVTNSYILVGNIGTPYGAVLFAPISKESELNVRKERLSRIKGISIQTAIVTGILIGGPCYRRFDNAYSIQHKILVETAKDKPMAKISYA